MIIIQPININGSLSCPIRGNNRFWRTASFLTDDFALTGIEDDDSWRMDGDTTTGVLEGTIKFGSNCIKSMTLVVGYDKDNGNENGFVALSRNGVEVWHKVIDLNRSTEQLKPDGTPFNKPFEFTKTLTFPADEMPCGDIWVISGMIPKSNSGRIFMGVDISVT